jgi:hypothetical protein
MAVMKDSSSESDVAALGDLYVRNGGRQSENARAESKNRPLPAVGHQS